MTSRHTRRLTLARLAGGVALLLGASTRAGSQSRDAETERRWIDAAFDMRRLAASWGDQPYGAVVVMNGEIVGHGPSRVVKLNNPDAHAEREAIRDALQRLGRSSLEGAVLYSTSRPCSRCERAAADARISRMIHGRELRDAGAPQL